MPCPIPRYLQGHKYLCSMFLLLTKKVGLVLYASRWKKCDTLKHTYLGALIIICAWKVMIWPKDALPNLEASTVDGSYLYSNLPSIEKMGLWSKGYCIPKANLRARCLPLWLANTHYLEHQVIVWLCVVLKQNIFKLFVRIAYILMDLSFRMGSITPFICILIYGLEHENFVPCRWMCPRYATVLYQVSNM